MNHAAKHAGTMENVVNVLTTTYRQAKSHAKAVSTYFWISPKTPGRRKSMTIGELLGVIVLGLGGLSTLFEVSKIQINPWSSLFKWIGKKMNAEVMEEIKDLKKSEEEIRKEQEKIKRQQAIDTADTIKAEVFSFYNECKRGLKHSEAEFNHIAQQNKKYLAIIEITKEPNGVYEMEYEYIMEIFKKAMAENDFL